MIKNNQNYQSTLILLMEHINLIEIRNIFHWVNFLLLNAHLFSLKMIVISVTTIIYHGSDWTLDQLKSMALLIAPRLRTSKHCSPFEAVCPFWTKLKTNLSFRQIGTFFKIDTQEVSICRPVEDTFHAVLVNLKEIVVLKYLRLSHLSRLEALNHHTAFREHFSMIIFLQLETTHTSTAIRATTMHCSDRAARDKNLGILPK